MTLHHCFFECICVPFSDINGGVVPRACIDSDADLPDLLRHRRYPEFRACDDASVAITRAKKANQLGIEKRLSGTYVFCGQIFEHFGHLITEYLHRVIVSSVLSDPSLPILMFKDEGSPLTAWQSDLLQICINRGREIVFYSEPVVVENLLVFEPLSGLWSAPSQSYLQLLSQHPIVPVSVPAADDFTNKIVYLTRSKIWDGKESPHGHVVLEESIEKELSKLGVSVVSPEKLSINSQLALFTSAKAIIAPEGSALHLLELLGAKACRHLIVLPRQYGERMALAQFKPRVKKLTYIDCVQCTRIQWRRGEPCPFSGLALFDFAVLFEALRKILGLDLPSRERLRSMHSEGLSEMQRLSRQWNLLPYSRHHSSICEAGRLLAKDYPELSTSLFAISRNLSPFSNEYMSRWRQHATAKGHQIIRIKPSKDD